MTLFDYEKYQLPDIETLNWSKTKENLLLFIQCYLRSRERIGVARIPKLDQHFSLFLEEHIIQEGKKYKKFYEEYQELHSLFVIGYSAIMHPCKPEITERRRKIFLLRYFYGLSITLVSERINYQRNIIIDESKTAILQFTTALGIHMIKE